MTTDALRICVNRCCQYHCRYCPLGSEKQKAMEGTTPMERLLPVVTTLVDQGFTRFEIAGGEPLLNTDIADLASRIRSIDGVGWLSITTNGVLLRDQIASLRDAGVDGFNIHIDTTLGYEFHEVTGTKDVLNDILDGIWKAVAMDFDVCITSALLRSTADSLPVTAGLAKTYALTVRLADMGSLAGDDALPVDEAAELLRERIGITRVEGSNLWDTGDWKGTVTTGRGIAGAFGMEDAWVLDVAGA